MRQGFRVIDSDTHVNPSLDVLLRYADKPLRDHLDEITPYMRKVKVQPGRGDAEDQTDMTILSIIEHTPVEYAQMGRVFCGIDLSEGVELTRAVIDLVGDHVLMFESDYPHPETIFPDHADAVIAWSRTLGEPATRKLMWENGSRFFRLTSTPWG